MDSFRHLMLAPDSAHRADLVTDLSLPLVAGQGLSSLTVRAVSALCGCSRQAVQQWFGGQDGLRRVVAGRFVARWRRWVPVRLRAYGLVGLRPDSVEVRQWWRFRLALLEHAHREEWLDGLVGLMLEDERTCIAGWLGVEPGDAWVVGLHGMLSGLPGDGDDDPVAEALLSLLACKQGEETPLPSR